MLAYALLVVDDGVHSTYRKVVSSPESVHWKITIDEEMQSLYKNGTWELVIPPKKKKGN